jgi:hypothetical protein
MRHSSRRQSVRISNGANNAFRDLTLEAVFKNGVAEADCIRLDADAVANTFSRVRTEAHVGSALAYGVFWNGGVANSVRGHEALGLTALWDLTELEYLRPYGSTDMPIPLPGMPRIPR